MSTPLAAARNEISDTASRSLTRERRPRGGSGRSLTARRGHRIRVSGYTHSREPGRTGLRGRLAGLRPYEPDPGHAGEGRGWTPMHPSATHRIDTPPEPDVLVIGGGIIGLVTAWRAAGRGLRAAVADPAPGGGAAQVAAGMLAAVTELHYGEQTLLGLNLASARRYPAFTAELEEATGQRIGYRRVRHPGRRAGRRRPRPPARTARPPDPLGPGLAVADGPRVPPPGADARPRGARRAAGGRRPPGRPAPAGAAPC